MNILQIISLVVSMISAVLTSIFAWVMIYRVNKTEVSFSGTPVDKKEFERHVSENKAEHSQLLAKIGGSERVLESRINERITRIEDNTEFIRTKMEADKTEILKTGEDRATKTHDRINQVLEAVAELRGQVTQMKK